MTFQKKLESCNIPNMLAWCIVVLFCPNDLSAEMGTTPNLKDIVIGRCFDYVTLVNPSRRYDCEEIWREFEEVVVRLPPCDVKVRDYRRVFRATPQTLPCDRLLFWSKTRNLMHIYAAVNHNLWILENTLVGYMFNDLIWCGQQETDRGFDFDSCPEWSACVNHPVYSLWRQASQNFAVGACGNITVLLNGSIHNAFNKKSMFGSVELDSLNPRMVDHVNIKVVTNMEGPFIESCTEGSILDLIKVLKSRGFRWTCTDNDLEFVSMMRSLERLSKLAMALYYKKGIHQPTFRMQTSDKEFITTGLTLMILQCIQNPKQFACQTCTNSPHRKISP